MHEHNSTNRRASIFIIGGDSAPKKKIKRNYHSGNHDRTLAGTSKCGLREICVTSSGMACEQECLDGFSLTETVEGNCNNGSFLNYYSKLCIYLTPNQGMKNHHLLVCLITENVIF